MGTQMYAYMVLNMVLRKGPSCGWMWWGLNGKWGDGNQPVSITGPSQTPDLTAEHIP